MDACMSPSNVFHLTHDDERTLCGVDLMREHSGPDGEWDSAPLELFHQPPWGKACKRCKQALEALKKFTDALDHQENGRW